MVNGGIGLMMSGYHQNTKKGEIAYGVIAGLMWVVWMAVVAWGQLRSKGASGETGEKAMGRSDTGSSSDRPYDQYKDA